MWDLKVRADAPLNYWMLAIGEAEERVEETAYTDGSKALGGLVGAGVVLTAESWHSTLSEEATVYDGEVEAIVEAIRRSRARKLLILTDCQSIVKAIERGSGDGLVTGGAVGRIWREAADREVALGWIKAHVGIPGNEAANVTAKRRAGLEDGVTVTLRERQRIINHVLEMRKKSRYKTRGEGDSRSGGAGELARPIRGSGLAEGTSVAGESELGKGMANAAGVVKRRAVGTTGYSGVRR